MKINLEALRERGKTNVEITIDFQTDTKQNFECYGTDVLNIDSDIAVIFRFGNMKKERISLNDGGTEHFSITRTFDLLSNPKEIRVFYWNNSDVLSELTCAKKDFISMFNNIRLDESRLERGDFLITSCEGNKEPRQGGNGGVVGVLEIDPITIL